MSYLDELKKAASIKVVEELSVDEYNAWFGECNIKKLNDFMTKIGVAK